MTSPIADSWIRIETWLAKNAPRTFAALEPPAEPSALAAAEQAIGQPLPAPLAESLLRHDGTGYHDLLPPFWTLLSTENVVAAWKLRTKIYGDDQEDAEEDAPEAEFGPWWHAQWIPFAADGAGDYLVVDQRPHRLRGRIGDADHETGCQFRPHPAWASLPALLDATATSLETGEAVGGYLPVVVDEAELDWEIL